MHYYPWKLRHRPITILVVMPILIIWFAPSGLPVPWLAHTMDWRALFIAWGPAISMAVIGLLGAWSSWFLLHRYRCTDSEIEEIDPVLQTRKILQFSEIRAVRDFVVSAGGQLGPRRGHVLVGRDGTKLWVVESLPIWPEIARHLEGIPQERQPLLRRLVL